MSAFIVNRKHIEYLVEAARKWSVDCYNHTPEKIGQILMDENVRSINYRYKESYKSSGYGIHRATLDIDPVQVIKACNCLDYQSGDHPEWEESESCKFLDSLKREAICYLPGYNLAKWEIT